MLPFAPVFHALLCLLPLAQGPAKPVLSPVAQPVLSSSSIARFAPLRIYGSGVAASPGLTKSFAFWVERSSRYSQKATGMALLIQRESTRRYGDFLIRGAVRCVYVRGDRAVLGITILAGSGTAAGRVGETFYIRVRDGRGRVPDMLDNSGYPGRQAHNCTRRMATGQVVITGDIVIQ